MPWWGMPATRLPMFPLGAVLFPHASMPLHVFEPRYRALMRDCLAGDHRFGVVLIARGSEVGGGDQRTALGTRGVITEAIELADGRWVLEVEGEARIEVTEWLPDDPYPVALVAEHAPRPRAASSVEDPGAAPGGRRPAGAPGPGAAGRARRGATAAARPGVRRRRHRGASWQLCAPAPVSAYDAQRLLAAGDVAPRLRLLVELMEELELDLHRMLTAE